MAANSTSMKRAASIVLSLGLLGGMLAGSADAAPIPCAGAATKTMKDGLTKGGMETATLRTLEIDAEVKAPTYRVGDIAKFPVHVTRPAKEDPLRQGLPWERPYVEDAAGVNIGVGLLIGDVFLPGFATTNDEGKAVIQVKIASYVRPATADAAFYSWNVVAEVPCFRVEENGFKVFQGMFTVKKHG